MALGTRAGKAAPLESIANFANEYVVVTACHFQRVAVCLALILLHNARGEDMGLGASCRCLGLLLFSSCSSSVLGENSSARVRSQ